MNIKGILTKDPEYVVVTFPDSQIIEGKEGFLANCALINSDEGIEAFGSGAYKVDNDWLEKVNAGEVPDKEYTEDELLLLDIDYETDWFADDIEDDNDDINHPW